MSSEHAYLLNLWSGTSKLERGEPVLAEDHGDLRAVLKLVLNEMPDHPSALHRRVTAGFRRQDELEVICRPAPEALFDQLPGPLECEHELSGSPGTVLVVLPAGIAERQSGNGCAGDVKHVAHFSCALAEHVVEPVRAAAGHVARQLPYRPMLGPIRRAKRELIVAESPEKTDEPRLMVGPPGIGVSQARRRAHRHARSLLTQRMCHARVEWTRLPMTDGSRACST